MNLLSQAELPNFKSFWRLRFWSHSQHIFFKGFKNKFYCLNALLYWRGSNIFYGFMDHYFFLSVFSSCPPGE